MSKTIFKRLAEVQILHDYFLTMADGVSFFERNKDEKKLLLEKRIMSGMYSGASLFEMAPLRGTKERMRENKILFAATPIGFILGAEVDEVPDAGEIRYRPVAQITAGTILSFFLKPKLPYFKSFTNTSLTSPYPAGYYFTNKDKQELTETTVPPQTSLPLTNAAPAPVTGASYEMGTVLNFGGTLRQALQKTDGTNPAHWEDVVDRRFITDADKILLPHNFLYRFTGDQLVTHAEITLEDPGNTIIKKIVKDSVEPMEAIYLNFTKVDENDQASAEIPSGIYTLKVKRNGSPETTQTVYLGEEEYSSDYFGLVQLRFDEQNSPFSLIDAQGFLKTKVDAATQKVSHPVFEIRLQNRRSFWRYHKTSDFSTDEINATSAHLEASGTHLLIAKKPKGLTAGLIPFRNGTDLMLPHPKTPNIRVEQDKIYSDIFINQSNTLLKS